MAKRLTKTMRGAFIAAVMDDVPSVDYNAKMRTFLQAAARAALPSDEIRNLYKKFPNLFNHEVVHTNAGFDSVVVVAEDYASAQLLYRNAKAARELEALSKVQRAQRDALREKVKALIFSCNTVEQVHARMPEFAKYIGAGDAPVDRSVPVIQNVIADFINAGWPK